MPTFGDQRKRTLSRHCRVLIVFLSSRIGSIGCTQFRWLASVGDDPLPSFLIFILVFCRLVLVNDPDDAIFPISLNLETYRSLLDGFPLIPNLNKWDDRLWPCIHISIPSVSMINTWCYSLNFDKTLFSSSSSSDRSNDDQSNAFVTAMATISLQNQRLISDRNKQ